MKILIFMTKTLFKKMSFFHLDSTIGKGITPFLHLLVDYHHRSGISPCPEDFLFAYYFNISTEEVKSYDLISLVIRFTFNCFLFKINKQLKSMTIFILIPNFNKLWCYFNKNFTLYMRISIIALP